MAALLGYNNTRDALSKRVDAEDKGVANCDSLGGTQNVTIINESGLYSVIMSSKMEKAKEFKRWVTSEVLPSIRKTGAYDIRKDSREQVDDEDKGVNVLFTPGGTQNVTIISESGLYSVILSSDKPHE